MSNYSAESTKKQIDNCTYCPKLCRHACPVAIASAQESLIPQRKMTQLGRLVGGQETWSSTAAENLWACTGCRQCTTFCEHANEPGLVLFAGRAEARKRDALPPALANYDERFRKRDDRLNSQLHNELDDDDFARTGDVGYLPGCDAVDKDLDSLRHTTELLNHVSEGTVPLVQSKAVCVGHPLLAGGFVDEFRWHAAKMAATLNGFRVIVTDCSACLHTLRASYAAEGIDIHAEILSVVEYLATRVDKLAELPPQGRVYYHDPCYLARYEGVIAPPRRVLEAIATVTELQWSAENTECCGGAGVLPKTMPDIADDMAKRRLREVAASGGGTITTPCPTCAFMLRQNAPDSVEVVSLSTLVARALRAAG